MLIARACAAWRDADGVRAATGHQAPADGLHYRWPDLPSLRIETSAWHDKLAAVRAFARVNSIDREVIASPHAPRVGIVTCGKAHYDLMEVLRRLEITPAMLAAAGVRLYKVGLSFPLETTRMQRLRARAGRGPGRRGEGRGRRDPAARAVLQRGAAASARHRRQARCAGRAAGVGRSASCGRRG